METRNSKTKLAFAVPAGSIIESELQERGIAKGTFADAIKVKRSNFSDILSGKRRVTKTIALRVEETLGLPSHVLLKLQTNYDVYKREQKERAKPKSAIEIANKIIEHLYSYYGEELATNMMVQKLLYYQQAHHLAKIGTPLFNDTIEAWQYGPVVPSVYQKFKSYGSRKIRCPQKEVLLTWDAEKLFAKVMEKYCEYSTIGLMHKTHSEKPWKEAVKNGYNTPISENSMQEFFKGKRI